MSTSSNRVSDRHVPETVPGSFAGFFETWLHEQGRDLEAMKDAARAHAKTAESTRSLSKLVGRVIAHYEKYYRVKSDSAEHDVLGMLNPAWRSNLEDAFFWVGGWRPSTAFHLLYSVSGSQFEDHFSTLMMSGPRTGDLGDLSPSQLSKVNDLQQETVKEERELTELMASHQETVADSSMVQLSHIATELTRDDQRSSVSVDPQSVNEQVESTIESKEEKLKEILRKADDLRMRTLKKVVQILSPIQAVHFLTAAAQLHLRVHEWGMNKDRCCHAVAYSQ
ncbi:Protein DOG1-like 3 [Bienertia sinuspersici]